MEKAFKLRRVRVEGSTMDAREAVEERVSADEQERRGPHRWALGFETLSADDEARAQAWLFIAAAVVGALGVVLPHPERYHDHVLLANQTSSLLGSCLLLALGARTPRWLIAVGPYAAALLTSVAVVGTGSSTSAYVLFYVWVTFYAFYFLPGWRATGLAVFTLLNYTTVAIGFRLVEEARPLDLDSDVPFVVLIAGTIAVAGVFITLLRGRLGRMFDHLTDAATTDPLTGLLNRRGLHQAIETELARHHRTGRPFSVVLADLDFFKRVNDAQGHQGGDEALITVAAIMQEHGRSIDVVARFGGEEFAIVLPDADEHEALSAAERLRHRIADRFAQEPVPLTASFGVASFPGHGATADALLRNADGALYAAKALGRARCVLWSPDLDDLLATRDTASGGPEASRLASILALAEALDMRDPLTARHSETVARLCELMARQLGLPPSRVARIRVAGVLHDVGKISIPDAVLGKPGALDADEMAQMRRHPEAGARLVGGAGLADIHDWVLSHHERPDGEGYPRGLSGDEIPLEARILAVADAYEAMTADRVYRPALGSAVACEELRRCTGTQFDATVVAALLEVLSHEEETGREQSGPLLVPSG